MYIFEEGWSIHLMLPMAIVGQLAQQKVVNYTK